MVRSEKEEEEEMEEEEGSEENGEDDDQSDGDNQRGEEEGEEEAGLVESQGEFSNVNARPIGEFLVPNLTSSSLQAETNEPDLIALMPETDSY